jgi:PAS domain S-box-containing protein
VSNAAADIEAGDESGYRLLIDAITDYAIYRLSPEGRVVSWNPGAERFKGYKAHEILGEHFSRFYTEEDRAAGLPERALEVARTEGRIEREGWRVRKDGTRFWAHVVIDPIRDPSGRLLGYAKITRDLTERKRVEEALKVSQRQLEEAREQLYQAQKMEAIGQLTGGIAHDFNNLLMAVLGSLELVSKRLPTDDKAQRLIENAVQGAERGISLTRRMLAFARRQDLKIGSVNLKETVDGMIELLTPTLGPLISIQNWVSPDLPPAKTDQGQFETALLNLVVNARDAMPNGGTITVGATEKDIREAGTGLAHGRYVCLTVTDTGEGMDTETLARAVEPFFTTKGVGKGTGLGLSMVHGLAEQSGGKLTLASSPSHGTTAELWLPTTSGEAATAVERQSLPRRSPGGVLHVIAVDDDPLVLMNTAAMLEDLGHIVTEARSAADAIALIRTGTPVDVVVTDHAMPQMTGSELVQLLRSERPGLPIVLATGYAELPRGSVVDVPKLSKPFRQQELADALRDALDREPAH